MLNPPSTGNPLLLPGWSHSRVLGRLPGGLRAPSPAGEGPLPQDRCSCRFAILVLLEEFGPLAPFLGPASLSPGETALPGVLAARGFPPTAQSGCRE